MDKIISALFIIVFTVGLIGCSSDDSIPEIITPEEGKYSIVITAHDRGRLG